MARAITSFPVPVSPWIRTAESTGATLSTSVSNARNFALEPIKSRVVIVLLLARYISRIVARVAGGNYRFIYAGNNGADNLEIIPAERFLEGSALRRTQRVRDDK